MQINVYSEKQFQCGASIAALRLTSLLSHPDLDVKYCFERPSKNASVSELFPATTFARIENSGRSVSDAMARAAKESRQLKAALERRLLDDQIRIDMKSGPAHVAHFHNYFGQRKTLVDVARSTPLVWTMHDTSPVTGYHYRTQALNGAPLEYKSQLAPASERFWEELRGLPFALSAPSKWLADYAAASTPDFIRVEHIPNALPSNMFFPMDKQLARAIVGIPPEGLFTLFFAGKGAWQRKNFEIIARAFAQNPDLPITVLVVGGVADKSLLGDDRFKFLPPFDPIQDRNKIVALYNAVDAFCLSSLIDNLPNTVLEAIHCGTPIIGANTGGVPDMVSDGLNGWLFDPRDASSLAAALRRFVAFSDELPKIGAASLDIAHSRFSHQKVRRQFLGLYDDLSGSGLEQAA